MPSIDRHHALHHALGCCAKPVFVSHDVPACAHLQQFAGGKQEIGARGSAVGFVALGKRFIKQCATFAHAGQQLRPQGAPQVVGDHHRIKLLARQRPCCIFDIGLHRLDACG